MKNEIKGKNGIAGSFIKSKRVKSIFTYLVLIIFISSVFAFFFS